MKWIARLLLFAQVLFAVACVPEPEPPAPPAPEAAYRGLLILNEGQWTQNNATLDYYNPADGWARTADVFRAVNNLALGDVANHAYRDADTLFIVMNNSLRVYKLQLPSLKLLGTLETPPGSSPRHMMRFGPHKAYLTSLLDAKVYVFDPASMTLLAQIEVENYMEDLALVARKLFVTCGSYTPALPGQTLAAIDPETDAVTHRLTLPVVNPGPLLPAPDGRLWVGCRGDYAGGGSAVVLVNPNTMQIDTTLRLAGSLYEMFRVDEHLGLVTDSALTLVYWPSFIVQYNWRSRQTLGFMNNNDLLYTVYFDARRRELYVTDAGVGAQPATVRVYTERGELIRTLPAGIFPGQFIWID